MFSASSASRTLVPAVVLLNAFAPALASAQAASPKIVTVTAAVDFTNAYMFRGIRQDDTKIITWPYVDLGLAAYSGDGTLKSAGLNFGTWNSFHPGDAGSTGPSGKPWYERDFYAALALEFDRGVSVGTTYKVYTSPNDVFSTRKEIVFKVGADDSAYLGRGAVKPYALVAFELDSSPGKGQADAGLEAGRYLEVGVGPGMSSDRVTLTLPIKVGMSLGNYYEKNVGTPAAPVYMDNTFGYFSAALLAIVPLKTPPTAGTWNVHGGMEVLALGDTPKALNNGDRSKVIGTIGIGLVF